MTLVQYHAFWHYQDYLPSVVFIFCSTILVLHLVSEPQLPLPHPFFIFGVFSNLILFLVFRASFVKNKIRNIYFGWFPYFLTFELVTYRLLRFVWAPGPFKVLWYLLVFRKLYSYAFLFTLQFLEFWFILFCEYIRN